MIPDAQIRMNCEESALSKPYHAVRDHIIKRIRDAVFEAILSNVVCVKYRRATFFPLQACLSRYRPPPPGLIMRANPSH